MLIEGGEERREKDEFIHVEDERVDVYFIRSIRHYIVSQGKVGSRGRSSCKFIYIWNRHYANETRESFIRYSLTIDDPSRGIGRKRLPIKYSFTRRCVSEFKRAASIPSIESRYYNILRSMLRNRSLISLIEFTPFMIAIIRWRFSRFIPKTAPQLS